MTPEESKEYRKACGQRTAMALYLKHTRQCACCLHRLELPYKDYCPDCTLMDSKWEWGGWKGKPNPEWSDVGVNTDYLFRKYEELK